MDWELRSGLTVYLHAFDSVICFSEPIFFSIIDAVMVNSQGCEVEIKEYEQSP